MRHGRQVARRSGVAALAGMKLAGSQTEREHAVVFTLFTLTPGQNDAGWGLLETKRVATGRTGAGWQGDKVAASGALRAVTFLPFHLAELIGRTKSTLGGRALLVRRRGPVRGIPAKQKCNHVVSPSICRVRTPDDNLSEIAIVRGSANSCASVGPSRLLGHFSSKLLVGSPSHTQAGG